MDSCGQSEKAGGIMKASGLSLAALAAVYILYSATPGRLAQVTPRGSDAAATRQRRGSDAAAPRQARRGAHELLELGAQRRDVVEAVARDPLVEAA